MFLVEALQRADWTAAMKLALGQPEEPPSGHVEHCVSLLADGIIDPGAVRIARGSDGSIVGVQVCAPLEGASCLFWLPAGPEDVAGALVEACLDGCRARGTKVAQAFVSDADLPRAQPMLRHGFRHITRMHQMQHSLEDLPPREPTPFRLETLASAPSTEFAETLRHTYEGTLDCPELNGRRDIDEIIAGHRAEGNFDPGHWWLAYEGIVPIGVLMLAELQADTWDLAYVGIIPQRRGRGFGRTMLRHAMHFCRAKSAKRLIVAVDGRNTPALRLYQSHGFAEFETCEVLLNFLQPSGPAAR